MHSCNFIHFVSLPVCLTVDFNYVNTVLDDALEYKVGSNSIVS